MYKEICTKGIIELFYKLYNNYNCYILHTLKFSFVMYSRTTFSSTNAGRIYRLNRKISTNRPNSTNDS